MDTRSKSQIKRNRGISFKKTKLLLGMIKAKMQSITEEEKKERFIAAQNLLTFSEKAIYKPVTKPESDNTADLTMIIPLQNLFHHESASDSSPFPSTSESPSSAVSEHIELSMKQKQLLSSKTILNHTAPSKMSQEWNILKMLYHPLFEHDNKVTKSQKELILKFVFGKFDKLPKSGIEDIQLSDYIDTVFWNNMLVNRHSSDFF